MATVKRQLKEKVGGGYDVIHLETSAEQVIQDSTRRFLTDAERTSWNAKEDASNKKTDLTDNSDTFYPSQKAVKTAVDAKLSPNGSANNLTFTDTNSHYTTDEVGEALVQLGAEVDALETKLTRAISFYVDGTLTVDTKLCSVIAPFAMTITEIRIAVDTAPTGADLIIDVNKNGTTLYTTQGNRPTITAGNTSATATDPDVTAIAVGDKISIDVDQIGSTVAGDNLMVTIICEV